MPTQCTVPPDQWQNSAGGRCTGSESTAGRMAAGPQRTTAEVATAATAEGSTAAEDSVDMARVGASAAEGLAGCPRTRARLAVHQAKKWRKVSGGFDILVSEGTDFSQHVRLQLEPLPKDKHGGADRAEGLLVYQAASGHIHLRVSSEFISNPQLKALVDQIVALLRQQHAAHRQTHPADGEPRRHQPAAAKAPPSLKQLAAHVWSSAVRLTLTEAAKAQTEGASSCSCSCFLMSVLSRP